MRTLRLAARLVVHELPALRYRSKQEQNSLLCSVASAALVVERASYGRLLPRQGAASATSEHQGHGLANLHLWSRPPMSLGELRHGEKRPEASHRERGAV